MILYHGSQTGGIEVLQPRLADHDRPYVYLSTIEVVAAFYLCNGVERPYYWFPYGFAKSKPGVPYYDEMYPNALQEVSEGVHGYIYKVDATEEQVIPFKSNPCARLGTAPLPVCSCVEVPDAYALMLEYEKQGRLIIARFENKSEKILNHDYSMILDYIRSKQMHKTPDCSYAAFVRKKFPFVWEQYMETLNTDQK